VGDDVYGGVSGVVKGLIRDMCMITYKTLYDEEKAISKEVKIK
jgi:hypothetical protein